MLARVRGELSSYHTPFAPLIPNSLLRPNTSRTPLLVKSTILMGCTSVFLRLGIDEALEEAY